MDGEEEKQVVEEEVIVIKQFLLCPVSRLLLVAGGGVERVNKRGRQKDGGCCTDSRQLIYFKVPYHGCRDSVCPGSSLLINKNIILQQLPHSFCLYFHLYCLF